jgi:NAD+ synthetase
VRIALCQLDQTVGDFDGNAARILDAAARAAREGAALAVFPELAVTGYPPQDLLHKPTFLEANDRALARLAGGAPEGTALLVGCIARNPGAGGGGKPLVNAAALVERGAAPRVVARKCLLPTYDVFDEARHFEPWARPEENLLDFRGRRLGITICEDIWNDATFWGRRIYALDPVEALVGGGADAVVNLSSSPWQKEKEATRFRMVEALARRHARPVVYVNQVGANDGLIFDGGSHAVDAAGRLLDAPVQFEESVRVVDIGAAAPDPAPAPPGAPVMEKVRRALALGIRGYFGKQGFTRAVLGLSGGIDSSVTAVLAVDALGPENVVGISMPSQYSSAGSKTDAAILARNLGIRLETVAIGGLFDGTRAALAPIFGERPEDVTEENIQARIRGQLLMAYSNKLGHIVLTTGNKTECSIGFCTLYGDTCGGLAVLADLWKTEVYALARHVNEAAAADGRRFAEGGGPIPPDVLVKPASPELKPGQVTQHHVPPFDVIDPLLAQLVEEEVGPEEAARRTGAPLEVARWAQKKLSAAEYKRAQFAPALRVSKKAWVGRSYPIVHRFAD